VNEISKAGLVLAKQIALAYVDHSNVRVVIVGGSISRGCADHYSDLEIGVFWSNIPSPDERKAASEGVGGDLWAFDREPGNEHYGLSEVVIQGKNYTGTAMISTQHLTVTDVELCLSDVIDRYDTSVHKQVLLSAIRHAIPLYGAELLKEWQTRAATYPDELAIKVIQENLWFGPWFWPEAYIERDDILVLFQHFVWIEQCILKVLAGLNRIYYPSSEYKWMDEVIGEMKIAPLHLSSRLKQVFRVGSQEGWRQLKGLINETIALVEAHLPEVDHVSLFKEHPEVNLTWAKQRWATDQPYNLIQRISASE
jgi:hypothetical protein